MKTKKRPPRTSTGALAGGPVWTVEREKYRAEGYRDATADAIADLQAFAPVAGKLNGEKAAAEVRVCVRRLVYGQHVGAVKRALAGKGPRS